MATPVIWVHSSTKAARDGAARAARIEAGLAAIDAVATRLASPKTRIKTRVQGSGHGVIFRVWSGAGFDLVAQDEVGPAVAGFGGCEVLAQFGDSGGRAAGW